MRRLLLPLALSAGLLCGCARQYVVKLNNGLQITTPHKPVLKGSSYYYKDAKGNEQVIPQSRVQLIEPASMAREETQFTPQQPKQKHWYWPF